MEKFRVGWRKALVGCKAGLCGWEASKSPKSLDHVYSTATTAKEVASQLWLGNNRRTSNKWIFKAARLQRDFKGSGPMSQ
jgi:hypothetical protein